MRKSSLGRKYYHKKIEILKGHSIMISVGSPNGCREHGTVDYDTLTRINGTKQLTNRLEYIPFERTKIVSGKKSRDAFEKDLKSHWEKVHKAEQKYSNHTAHILADIKKTSQIIKY